jgi:hypothetical protein
LDGSWHIRIRFSEGSMEVDLSGPLSLLLPCGRRIRRLIKIPDRSAKAPVNNTA